MLRIENLSYRAGSFCLRGIPLHVRRNSYTILLGPTGSGKTTLLKCILGLYSPTHGTVYLNGRDITASPPEERRIGYVPQNYALFPHLSVEGNILFGLRIRGARREEERIFSDLSELLDIGHLRQREVSTLSSGEQQKVALARAIASRPEIVLMDEPFSAIDESSRRGLWVDLKRVILKLGITTLHVTHNLEEAYTLGEDISVIISGEIAQSAPKETIFERPASESVARYLNYRNIFKGTAEQHPDGSRIRCDQFDVIVRERIPAGSKVKICIRQQDLKIVREGFSLRDSLKDNVYAGEVVSLLTLPEMCIMQFRMEGSPRPYDLELRFPAYISERYNLSPGKKIRVAMWEPRIIIFG